MSRPPDWQSNVPAGRQISDRQALQMIAVACLLEKNWRALRQKDEPELPPGYRHIRSAIGALLTLGAGPDCLKVRPK